VLPGAEPADVGGAQLLHSARAAQKGGQAEASGVAPTGQRLVRRHPQFLHAAAHHQGGQAQGQGSSTYAKNSQLRSKKNGLLQNFNFF